MSAMAYQITGVSIVYSAVCTDADKENIQNPRHWPFWGEFTGWPVNSPHKGPVTRKMFDDSIMLMVIRRDGCLPDTTTDEEPNAFQVFLNIDLFINCTVIHILHNITPEMSSVQSNQHSGSRWTGVYLAPGHRQPSRRFTLASIFCDVDDNVLSKSRLKQIVSVKIIDKYIHFSF